MTLQAEHVLAVREGGAHGERARAANDAIKAAFDHRAGLAYIRPASAYLRSSYASSTLLDDSGATSWQNMLHRSFKRGVPVPYLSEFWANGGVLYEDLVYDGNGQLLTTSFMDYILPTAKELPAVEVAHVETLPPVSVSGFKGMGEGGTLGATAAAANAVADALAPLGIRVDELPLTPDRIYRLIHHRPEAG